MITAEATIKSKIPIRTNIDPTSHFFLSREYSPNRINRMANINS
jgi:hypothetical protein